MKATVRFAKLSKQSDFCRFLGENKKKKKNSNIGVVRSDQRTVYINRINFLRFLWMFTHFFFFIGSLADLIGKSLVAFVTSQCDCMFQDSGVGSGKPMEDDNQSFGKQRVGRGWIRPISSC